MEVLGEFISNILLWGFIAISLTGWIVIPAWIVNGAKKEDLKMFFFFFLIISGFFFSAIVLSFVF
jgi:hypothetical protein